MHVIAQKSYLIMQNIPCWSARSDASASYLHCSHYGQRHIKFPLRHGYQNFVFNLYPIKLKCFVTARRVNAVRATDVQIKILRK